MIRYEVYWLLTKYIALLGFVRQDTQYSTWYTTSDAPHKGQFIVPDITALCWPMANPRRPLTNV